MEQKSGKIEGRKTLTGK